MPKAKGSGAKKSPPKYRSAVTGHYVSPRYAKTHPKTTVKESKEPDGGYMSRRPERSVAPPARELGRDVSYF